ncbi:hypothetical protein D9M71_156430 [compost metagenome]
MKMRNPERRQHGTVLLVALVMLLVLTTLTLTSMRGTALENRLVGNQAEERQAFNAGEAALREGERKLARLPGADDDRRDVCDTGMDLCVVDREQVQSANGGVVGWRWSGSPADWWMNDSHALAYRGSDNQTQLAQAPRLNAAYFDSDSGCSLNGDGVCTDYYYVTTYATAGAGRTPLILQSVLARRYSN